MDRRKRAKTGKIADMAHSLAASRHARLVPALLARCFAVCFSAFRRGRRPRPGCAAGAADQPPAPASQKPEAEKRAGMPIRRRPARPSNIGCRRIPPPSKPWCFPGARSPSRRPRARSGCSTTRANRRPISPIPPISSTAPIAATRPVTFLFNGGPGAASAYLQLGAAGPWRLPISGDAGLSSASPDLQPNAETWLDFHRSRLHRSRRHRL